MNEEDAANKLSEGLTLLRAALGTLAENVTGTCDLNIPVIADQLLGTGQLAALPQVWRDELSYVLIAEGLARAMEHQTQNGQIGE